MNSASSAKTILFSQSITIFLLFIFSGCDTVTNPPSLPAEMVGTLVASDTRPVPTPTFTATATVAPSPTLTPRPTFLPTPSPSPTITPYFLEEWEIAYTARKIDDPNDPINAIHREVYSILLNQPQAKRLVENPRDVFDPQWSPDGKRIAFLSYNKHPPSLFILDLATRQTHEFENVWLFDWSRDGQALVFCEYGTWPWAEDETFHFYLVQMEDLDHPRVVMVAPWRAIELRWSPTADRILASGGRQVGADLATHLYLFDLQGRVQQLPITEVPGGHVAWHPDGEQIAYDVYNDTVTVVSEIRGLDLRTFEGQALTHSGEIAEYPEWSPDGKRVAFISKPLLKNSTTLPTYRVSLLDLETGKTTQLETRLKEKHMLFPTWSPDGKYLAFLQGAETPGTWLTLSYSLNIYDLRAGRITTLLRQGLDQTAPDWKPQR